MLESPADSPDTVNVGPASATPSLDLEGRRAFAAVASRLTGRQRAVEVGRYELDKQLGQGGFGAVFEAYDPQLDRRVAIKVVKESSAGVAKARERLAAEARALAQLGDRHVVQVFDVGTDELEGRPHLYIVMELLQGPTLAGWLSGETRPIEEIVSVFIQAAKGLHAGHGVGVVHRDFKPANAMFAADGRLKVLDFGLAFGEGTAPSTAEGEEPVLTRLTQTGTVMGTPRYMAPEQHRGDDFDARADQYSFCVALWEAVLGEPPFSGQTLASLAWRKREGPPSRPSAMPRHLYRTLARGLAPDPGYRFASMAELIESLAPPRRTRAVAAGAAVLGLAGLASLSLPEPLPAACDGDPSRWAAKLDALIEAGTPARDSGEWGLQTQIARRLDRFAQQWPEVRDQVCDTEQPLAVGRAKAGACLQRGSDAFDAILALPTESASLRRIEWKVMSLPVPSRCLGSEAETLFVSDPVADEKQAFVAQRLGEPTQDGPEMEELEELAVQASELGNHWLSARVQQYRGGRALANGDPDLAAEALDQAVWHAENAQDTLLAAELLPIVIGNLLDTGMRADDLQPWLERGHRILEQAGRPPGPAARLLVVEGMIVFQYGDRKEAIAKFEEAFEAVGQEPPPGAEAQFALGKTLSVGLRADEMSPEEMIEECRAVLAMGIDSDPWYPALAGLAQHMISEAALMQGDLPLATVERTKQIGYLLRTISTDSIQAWLAIAGHGRLLSLAGADEIGVPQQEYAYRKLSEKAGVEGRLRLIAADLTEVHFQRRDFESALRWARLQEEGAAAQLGADNSELFWAYSERARAAAHMGELEEAVAALTSAEGVADPQSDDDHQDLALAIGEVALAQGQLDRAETALLEALEGLAEDDRDPREQAARADACDALAKVYEARGQTDRQDEMLQCRDRANTLAGPLRQ